MNDKEVKDEKNKFLDEVLPDLIADILLATRDLSVEASFLYIKNKAVEYKLNYDDLLFVITYCIFVIKGICKTMRPFFDKIGVDKIVKIIMENENV